MRVFINGLLTGLVIQTAIGPVFFFIMNLALQRSLYDGLVAAVAVTLADYLYIALALLGIGTLLENKNVKKMFGILSSVVLIIFGALIIKGITTGSLPTTPDAQTTNLLASFTTTFLLAISNPMVIVWNIGLLTAKAVEYNYTKRELVVFALSLGLAVLIFMGGSVILFSFIQKAVPPLLIKVLNVVVGGLLIVYGAVRLKRVLRPIR